MSTEHPAIFTALRRRHSSGDLFEFPAEALYRTVNGGYLTAACLRYAAMEGYRPECVNASFLRPVRAGEVTATREVLVSTSAAACLEVTLAQREKVAVRARVWLSAHADGPEHRAYRAPQAPSPYSLTPTDESRLEDRGFWSVFEQRRISRAVPSAQGPVPPLLRWFKYREELWGDCRFAAAAKLMPIFDLMGFPAGSSPGETLLNGRGAVTLSLDVQLFEPVGHFGWFLCEAHCPFAAEGTVSTAVNAWSADGLLLGKCSAKFLVQ